MPTTLALFIAYLFDHKYASSTVNTYVSALGYYHRLAGLSDPTKTFYVIEMLKGYGKKSHKVDSRLPITLPILVRIMQAGDIICISPYRSLMFRAMCSLAFFAFLRIGEITGSSKTQSTSNAVLNLSQVSRQSAENGYVLSMKVTFLDFKHHYNQNNVSIVVTRQSKACPVQALLNYVSVRGTTNGPLFVNQDGSLVLRSEFTNMLSSALRICDLDPNRYKGHSFRIGAATYAAEQGFSDAKIRYMGRWKSDAFKKYIRISSLNSVT